MAAINKRGPHQWRAQIRKNGFPPQSKTFTTKAEAEAWARMTESEMSRGIWISRGEAESTSLKEALERYEREVTPNKKTAAGERSFIRIWKATHLAGKSLALIRSTDVAKTRDEWLKEGYAAATVVRRLALLSHVFNMARKEWGMESLTNPVELVRKPQIDNARTRRIMMQMPSTHAQSNMVKHASSGELEWIVCASQSAILPSIITLAIETAMRRSEISSLKWEHVNLGTRVAHLPETKNGSARDVPLSTLAVRIFKQIQTSQDQKNSGAEIPHQSGQIFKIRSDAITKAFERSVCRARKDYEDFCARSNIEPCQKFLRNLTFHDLRHEATSRLAEIFPMHELCKITGHKDPRMLLRYYHPKAEDLAKKLG